MAMKAKLMAARGGNIDSGCSGFMRRRQCFDLSSSLDLLFSFVSFALILCFRFEHVCLSDERVRECVTVCESINRLVFKCGDRRSEVQFLVLLKEQTGSTAPTYRPYE